MIDGATDSSNMENEAVYIRYVRDGEPVNSLVCLSEVSHAHADGIVDCIGTSMVQFGLENWKEKLVGFCADGANVNLGQTNGVVAKLREDNPKLTDIHCMAHRLELALMGVLKQNKMVSLVNDTLYLVSKTYHFSPKSSRELKQVCYELETRFYKPKSVNGTRWVPNLDRALKVFLKGENDLVNKAGGFSAVATHMENLGETSRNADVSGRGKKVSKTMKDLLFVAFCHFLSDVFQEVGALSLTLQKPELVLPCAVSAVDSCLTSLDYMKTEPMPDGMLEKFINECLEKQTPGVRTTSFQTLELKGNRDSLMAELRPHMTSVCEACEQHLHLKFDNLLGANKDDGTQAAVSAFSIFNPDRWPDGDMLQLELLYGHKELKVLTDWYKGKLTQAGCQLDQLPKEWRKLKRLACDTFKDKSYAGLYSTLLTKDPYKMDLKNILLLVQILLVLPISSANCERAFSAQKRKRQM